MPYKVEACRRSIRGTVRRWTGAPAAVGLGPAQTLAAAATTRRKKKPALADVPHFGASPDPDGLWSGCPYRAALHCVAGGIAHGARAQRSADAKNASNADTVAPEGQVAVRRRPECGRRRKNAPAAI